MMSPHYRLFAEKLHHPPPREGHKAAARNRPVELKEKKQSLDKIAIASAIKMNKLILYCIRLKRSLTCWDNKTAQAFGG